MNWNFCVFTNANNDITTETISSMQTALFEFSNKGIYFFWSFPPKSSWPRQMNIGVSNFLLRTKIPYLITIDRDIIFSPADLERLYQDLLKGYDFIGGIYSGRGADCVSFVPLKGARITLEGNIQQCAVTGNGFTGYSRHLLETMVKELPLVGPTASPYYPFFEEKLDVNLTQVNGFDYDFCVKAQSAGFKVYVDTNIRLGHIGNYTWTVNDYLTRLEKAEIKMREIQVFDDGHAEKPPAVGMYINQRCNLKCKMCWVWKGNVQEISTVGMKKVFHHLNGVTSRLAIGGAEPLMREDLIELLEYANTQGLRPELLTNATLITKEIARELVKWCEGLIVSIDGNKEIHDIIRGEGNFDKAVRGIRLVHEAGNTLIRINATVSKFNVGVLDEVVDIASELRCPLSIQHLVFSKPKQIQEHRQALIDRLGIEDDVIPKLVSNLNELDADLLFRKLNRCTQKASDLGMRFHINPALEGEKETDMWYSGVEPIPRLGCFECWSLLFIRQDGEVLPCEFINYPLGNLVEQDLDEIWNGDKMRRFRRLIKKSLFPGCARCCKLEPFEVNKEGKCLNM